LKKVPLENGAQEKFYLPSNEIECLRVIEIFILKDHFQEIPDVLNDEK
jgi:hypothetical protein